MERKRVKRQRSKGQAVVETALMGLFLCLLLAGAVDFGRAFYTAGVVTNMAGEGAAYAALYPDQDQNLLNQSCSTIQPVPLSKTIQERTRRVALERGLIIERQDQNLAQIVVSTDGYDILCASRCAGRTITVRVTYRLDDLFLAGVLGINQISITKSASQIITRDPQRLANCGGVGDY